MDQYGSWVLVTRIRTPFRESFLERWEGLSKDVALLSTDPFMTGATGSAAFCIDTGDSYKYVAETKKWYKQQKISSGSGGSSGDGTYVPDEDVAMDSDVSNMLDDIFKG